MVVLGIALAIGRGIYLNSVPSNVLPANAAAVLLDTLVRFIKEALRTLLVVGLIVAIAAFFTGPSVTAVRTRHALASGLGWPYRATGERAGLRTGPVGWWIYQYRTALRIASVALIALLFVFWGAGRPRWWRSSWRSSCWCCSGSSSCLGVPRRRLWPSRRPLVVRRLSGVLVQAAGLAILAAISPTALLVAAVFLGSSRPRETLMLYLIGALIMSVVDGGRGAGAAPRGRVQPAQTPHGPLRAAPRAGDPDHPGRAGAAAAQAEAARSHPPAERPAVPARSPPPAHPPPS